MIDRLVHHAEILALKGCSYVKHGIIGRAETGVVVGCRFRFASADDGRIGRGGCAAMSSFQTVRASWRLRQRSASCRSCRWPDESPSIGAGMSSGPGLNDGDPMKSAVELSVAAAIEAMALPAARRRSGRARRRHAVQSWPRCETGQRPQFQR